MNTFKNILFVSQGLEHQAGSIGQALRLSSHNQALLKGAIFCPPLPSHLNQYHASYERSLVLNVDQQIDQSRSKNQISETSVPFPIEVICGDRPAINMIRTVQKGSHDLLLKDAEPVNENDEGFKALDMALLRKCPVPVWLYRPTNKPRNKRRVTVAIDPISTTKEQKGLCLKLIQLARYIADSCDSRLHILSCWEYQLERYLHEHVWIKVDESELSAELERSQLEHRRALDILIKESGIEGEVIVHHLHGLPDEIIPGWVDENEIDILVMGTLARTGVPGFFIGNTAENIVQSVKCSLVALKPEGFISPVS